VQEAEGTRRRDFAAEAVFFELVNVFLATDQSIVEFDFKAEILAVCGAQDRFLVTVFDADGFFDNQHLRAAFWRARPPRSIASMKGFALPSMIGVSGPSISTRALSTPSAAKADIRCSMVETVAPALLAMTVQRRVSATVLQRAAMTLSRSVISVRTKTMPLPTGAGCSVRMHADAADGQNLFERVLVDGFQHHIHPDCCAAGDPRIFRSNKVS